MDLAFCALALPLLVVATIFMAVMIQLGSPGPVFFHQKRGGYRGRRFTCHKFRTMKVGPETMISRAHCSPLIHSHTPMTKLEAHGDSRLIPGAWLIRATGLDELPQIINVLRGEMSLIGPRPLPYQYIQYLPWQQARFDVKPGLSGLWQVSGKNRTTFGEMIHLDLRYAQTMSLRQDFKILLMTLPTILGQMHDAHAARKPWADVPNPLESATAIQVE